MCVLEWVDVNAACLCRLHSKIPTPRVPDVGVGNVQAIRHVAIVIFGPWNSGKFIIKGVLMPNVIGPIVAILATPLSQAPLPHVLRLPNRQPPHQRPFPTQPPLPQRGRC